MNILRTRQVETCPDPQVHSRTQILWLKHQCFSYSSMLAHRKTIVCKTMGLSPGAKYCAFQLGSLWSLRNRLQIVHRTENHNPLNEHKLTRASFCKYCGWWLPSSHSWHLPPTVGIILLENFHLLSQGTKSLSISHVFYCPLLVLLWQEFCCPVPFTLNHKSPREDRMNRLSDPNYHPPGLSVDGLTGNLSGHKIADSQCHPLCHLGSMSQVIQAGIFSI